MKSNFSSSIDVDAASFITRCVAHVRGLKCEIVMDSHFDTVTDTSLGHRLWRAGVTSLKYPNLCSDDSFRNWIAK